MNTMLNRNKKPSNDIISRFRDFSENIRRSGRNPQEIYNELLNSGRYTKEQVDKAVALANAYKYLSNL